jgi:DNA-binding transcriptional LysR family regulator
VAGGSKGATVTPTQLRAFSAVVRLGSVKHAADELRVSEAAVSLNIAKLRRELGDQLFVRTSTGLAFTPGGLRLASRAAELLGLQDRTVFEVRQAAGTQRLLRIAASSLFAEQVAPGLIDLFTARAKDLDVELSVHSPSRFATALRNREVDVAIGPQPVEPHDALLCRPFLRYRMIAVVGPEHPLAGRTVDAGQLRAQTWLLGPSAANDVSAVSQLLRRLHVPEEHQQIFQSHAAAVDQAKRSKGVAMAPAFAVTADLASKALVQLSGPGTSVDGVWHTVVLTGTGPSPAAELVRFISTPRAIQAMMRGSGVNVGRFRPSIHITLWS